MVVSRATVLIGVFNGGMAGLNSLLRAWDVAARDCVQIGFVGNLGVHVVLQNNVDPVCS